MYPKIRIFDSNTKKKHVQVIQKAEIDCNIKHEIDHTRISKMRL